MGLVTKCDMSAIILPSASGKGQGRVTFEGSGRAQGGYQGGCNGGTHPPWCPLWGLTCPADLRLQPLPSDDGYTRVQYIPVVPKNILWRNFLRDLHWGLNFVASRKCCPVQNSKSKWVSNPDYILVAGPVLTVFKNFQEIKNSQIAWLEVLDSA